MTSASLELMLSAVFLDFFAGAIAALLDLSARCKRLRGCWRLRSFVLLMGEFVVDEFVCGADLLAPFGQPRFSPSHQPYEQGTGDLRLFVSQ